MSNYMKEGVPVPRVGDEVLIRGRVKEADQRNCDYDIRVELFSRVDQYTTPVRRDLIEQVIPADQTRTFKGFTVAATREAIRSLDKMIDDIQAAPAELSLAAELAVASLEDARADLVGQLEAIGVPVEDPS